MTHPTDSIPTVLRENLLIGLWCWRWTIYYELGGARCTSAQLVALNQAAIGISDEFGAGNGVRSTAAQKAHELFKVGRAGDFTSRFPNLGVRLRAAFARRHGELIEEERIAAERRRAASSRRRERW